MTDDTPPVPSFTDAIKAFLAKQAEGEADKKPVVLVFGGGHEIGISIHTIPHHIAHEHHIIHCPPVQDIDIEESVNVFARLQELMGDRPIVVFDHSYVPEPNLLPSLADKFREITLTKPAALNMASFEELATEDKTQTAWSKAQHLKDKHMMKPVKGHAPVITHRPKR